MFYSTNITEMDNFEKFRHHNYRLSLHKNYQLNLYVYVT